MWYPGFFIVTVYVLPGAMFVSRIESFVCRPSFIDLVWTMGSLLINTSMSFVRVWILIVPVVRMRLFFQSYL